MKSIRKLAGLLCLFSAGTMLLAQEKPKADSILRFTLKDAQTYALENNKSILNANIDVESAKMKIWETTAIGLPQVSAKTTFQYTPELSSLVSQFGSFGALPIWMWTVNDKLGLPNSTPEPPTYTPTNEDDMKWSMPLDITVSQLIFSGSYLVGLQSAKVYKSLSLLNQAKSKQDVLESVTNSYYAVLVARENAQILDSTYKNVNNTLKQLSLMNNQGFNDETDVDQLRITLTNIKTTLNFVAMQKNLAEKMLKLQLGIDLIQPVELKDSLALLLSTQAYDQLLAADLMLENNISYQLLDAQVKSSKLLLKLQQSECLPSIAAFYQYDKQLNDKSFNMNPPHVIGVSLSVPIFASGSRFAKIKQAQNDFKKSVNTRAQMSDGLKIQFYQNKASLSNARDKFTDDKQNLELSEKIYKRSLIKYQNGVISSLELTQAQNQFLTAQSTYYQSILNLINEKNKLEKMLTKN